MKNTYFYMVLGLSFIMNFVVSCSDSSDNNNPSDTSVDVNPIINAAQQGTWRVTHYTDHGDDKLNNFEGYTFTFGANNVLTATNGEKTRTGEWIVSTTKIAPYQSVGDQTPDDPVDFNIFFQDSESKEFTDINDDWDRLSMSDTKMEFIDISPTPGKEPDYITFEKN